MSDMDEAGFAVWRCSRAQRIRALKTNAQEVLDGLHSMAIICWELLTWRAQ